MQRKVVSDQNNYKVLKVFAVNCDKLSAAVKNHIPQKTTIRYDVGRPMKIEGDIDQTIEAGLVSTARLFMEGEVTDFNKVVNILLWIHKNDVEKVRRLRDFKHAWKEVFGLNRLFRIGSEDDNITNEKIFKLIAYGNHLHSRRHDEYTNLQSAWIYPFARVQLQSMIFSIRSLTTVLNTQFVLPLLEQND